MRRASFGRYKMTDGKIGESPRGFQLTVICPVENVKGQSANLVKVAARRKTPPKNRNYPFPRNTSYHEAGHAVARIYFGAPATGTRIYRDGTGYSTGGLEDWTSINTGIGILWDLLLMSMAGVHAEGRATKQSVNTLVFSSEHVSVLEWCQ